MHNDQEMLDRIAAFLSEYVRMAGGRPIPARTDAVVLGIAKLIRDGVFTAEQMRMEALRESSVIIPDLIFQYADGVER